MPELFKKENLEEGPKLEKPEDQKLKESEWHLLPEPSHMLPEHTGSQPSSPHDQDFDKEYFDPFKVLLSWKALSRPYRKKDRSYYTTVAILVTLISLIAFVFGERLLIGALLALAFVVYVLNFVEPEEIEYKLTSQGITIGEHFYHWNELDSFWIKEKDGFKILYVLTRLRFPGMLMVLMGNTAEEEVKKVVGKFLPFHEIPPKSLMEKWSESLQKHFPLENPHK